MLMKGKNLNGTQIWYLVILISYSIFILGCLSSLCSLRCRLLYKSQQRGHRCLHSSLYGKKMWLSPTGILDLPLEPLKELHVSSP